MPRDSRARFMRSAFKKGKSVYCEYCGTEVLRNVAPKNPRRATVDHKIPICRGGKNNRSNYAIACYGCNSAKGPLAVCEFLLLRHSNKLLKQAVCDIQAIMVGRHEYVGLSEHQRHRLRVQRRQEQLAKRLKDPHPNCYKCQGTGLIQASKRVQRYCPCAIEGARMNSWPAPKASDIVSS